MPIPDESEQLDILVRINVGADGSNERELRFGSHVGDVEADLTEPFLNRLGKALRRFTNDQTTVKYQRSGGFA